MCCNKRPVLPAGGLRSGKYLFRDSDHLITRWSGASIAVSALEYATARASEMSLEKRKSLANLFCIGGYSLVFYPSRAQRVAYTNEGYF